jgi:hypothetical protein
VGCWKKGEYKHQDFCQSLYKKSYRQHIRQLKDYGKKCKTKFRKMQKKIYAQLWYAKHLWSVCWLTMF